MEKDLLRDYNTEAQSLPHKQYQYQYDHIVRDFMFRSIEAFFRTGSALELGCYEGDTAVVLSRYFSDLTVLDASSEALAIAEKRLPIGTTIINSTFEEISAVRSFMNIFAINVLEHVDEPVPVLEKIRSVLEPGGRVFLVVPNADAPSRQIAVKMGIIPYNNVVTPSEWEHGHRRTYSFDTLHRDIKSAGLNIIHSGGLLFKPLANFQLDRALESGIIDMRFIEGTYHLGMEYPKLCSSIFSICEVD
jgi:2-polyprenyl-3-methyl-5-hydroxy-6-metoxy-1,4-benzoquinol methylase